MNGAFFIMIWILCFVLVVIQSGFSKAQNDSECPEPMELSRRIEQCLEPLSNPTKADNLIENGFTEYRWNQSCKAYHESMVCMQKLMAYCKDSPNDELEIGESMLAALHTGQGHLCDDPHIFHQLKRYSECYGSTKRATAQCWTHFSGDIAEANEMEESGLISLEHYTKRLCRAFNRLVYCVDTAISLRCGRQAADIFLEVVRAQLPEQYVLMCSPDKSLGCSPHKTPLALFLSMIMFYIWVR